MVGGEMIGTLSMLESEEGKKLGAAKKPKRRRAKK